MSLRQEIGPYIDGNGLVAPNIVPPSAGRGSDNGPMFTSEFFILLNRNKELNQDTDPRVFWALINLCIDSKAELHRAPGDTTPDAVDDYYGVLAASDELGIKSIPRVFLSNSKQFIRLIQPQVYLMALFAADSYKFYHFPLVIYSSLVLATSGMLTDINNSDSRRLAWLLALVLKKHSALGRLAAMLWERRLIKQYGPQGMRRVAQLYYRDNHPFQRYYPVV